MICQLFRSRRYGWIVGFALFVGIPAALMLLRQDAGIFDISGFFLYMLSLITFYAYTWLLRYSVGEWIEDLLIHWCSTTRTTTFLDFGQIHESTSFL